MRNFIGLFLSISFMSHASIYWILFSGLFFMNSVYYFYFSIFNYSRDILHMETYFSLCYKLNHFNPYQVATCNVLCLKSVLFFVLPCGLLFCFCSSFSANNLWFIFNMMILLDFVGWFHFKKLYWQRPLVAIWKAW